MNIGIIGLGLIGGSFAKATKVRTSHKVFGMDIDRSVVLKAKLVEAIDGVLTPEMISECDLVLVALSPVAAKEVLQQYAPKFKKGAVVVDTTGIKKSISALMRPLSKKYGFVFVGGHPMAGMECSGFDFSGQKLFSSASMILTPAEYVGIQCMDMLKQYFLSLGFAAITISTPEEHDRIIAYTSQLAHVVSGVFVRSKTAAEHLGFSAGSYKDMTRVATMNPEMWTQLFLENQSNLLKEVDGLIKRLQEVRQTLADKNAPALRKLLAEGNDRKANVG